MGLPAARSMANYRAVVVAANGEISDDAAMIVLEPRRWIGKRFPLFKHVDVGDELARGEWSLLFYHHDCPQCQRAIARFGSLPRATQIAAVRRNVLVEIPPFGPDPDHGLKDCLCAKLDADREWFAATPVAVALVDGIVVAVTNAPEIMAEIESSR